MKRTVSVAVLVMTTAGWNTIGHAATVTGTIVSTNTLLAACEINGRAADNGADVGTLEFGSHSPFFTSATTQVDSGSGGAISIRCAPGSDATLTITGGQHDGSVPGSGRALGTGPTAVAYDIYRDAALQNVLANGATFSVPANGVAQLVPIYGRALGRAGLAPGTYTDIISVSLTF